MQPALIAAAVEIDVHLRLTLGVSSTPSAGPNSPTECPTEGKIAHVKSSTISSQLIRALLAGTSILPWIRCASEKTSQQCVGIRYVQLQTSAALGLDGLGFFARVLAAAHRANDLVIGGEGERRSQPGTDARDQSDFGL